MTYGPGEPEQVSLAIDAARPAARAALLFIGLAVGAAMAAHLVDFGVYRLRIQAMNANLGTSPVAWASPAAILLALVASLVLVRRNPRRPGVILSISLAIVLVLATRQLGESLPHWQLLLLPPLGVTLAVLWHTAAELDRSTGRLLRGGCILLVSAFALHVFGAPVITRLGFGADSWPYQVKVAFKEGSEISGWMLIAAGLLVLAGPATFGRPVAGGRTPESA